MAGSYLDRESYWNRRLRRRQALGGSAAAIAGAGALLLVGCGDDSKPSSAGTPLSGGRQATAATPTVGAKAKLGGSIVTTAESDPTSLDPHLGQGGGDHQFFWTVFDNLVNYNQKGELDGARSLAESWEFTTPTRITLKLRAGIKFHDGTPFNAAAVKYNVERIQDPANTSSARASLLPITKVETPDDTHVTLVLDLPNAGLLTNLGDRGGAMISPASIEKFGKETGRNPVGTGPFKFKEWKQGDHVSVAKNPDYWGKDAGGQQFPYIDELRWNIVPDATVALANLDAGTIDLVTIRATDLDTVKAAKKYQVETFVGASWVGAYLNSSLAPMDDLHFRRAVAMAIDKAGVSQAIALGQGPACVGPLTPASWAYNPKLKGLDFNIEEAKKELAQSRYPNGTKLTGVTNNSATATQQVELWKQMLKKINVDLAVDTVAVAAATDRAFVKKDAAIGGFSGFSMRADPDGIVSETLTEKGFYNQGNRSNPKLEDLIVKARSTYVQAERKVLYDQIQQIAIDEVYQYYVYYSVVHSAAQTKVKNFDTVWGAEGKQRYKELWIG